MKIRILIFISLISVGLKGFSQEYLTGLSHGTPTNTMRLTKSQTLTLPFFDDFSENNVVTNANRWKNQYVFVNSGFPLQHASSLC